MKTNVKKVPRNFRLDPEVNEELVSLSQRTGIPETRLVEDGLRALFGEGQTIGQRLMSLGRELSHPKHQLAAAN